MLKLYNTLTRKVEEFAPLNPPKVGMYTCGPTVYDYMHIGNLRTFLLSDLLLRVLQANGREVISVQNITDINDKIINRAKEKGISVDSLVDEYTTHFLRDMNSLNILPRSTQPKATEHIGAIIKFIQALLEKGVAYVEKDGSVYFDISKFPQYGKLSGLEKRKLKTGTRVLSDEYTKDDAQDFALWKAASSEETGWDSPWGRGRPGWHIECSVMSQQILGDTLDIHIGGIDLIFPHHENEIAQSEAKTGKKFVNYFVHGEFLLVNGQKMSKSLKNYFTLRDIEAKGFEPLAFRYLVLTARYRDKLNFTWESLQAAQNALNNLREEIRLLEQPVDVDIRYWQKFLDAANNDLGIPQALALLHEMVRSDTPTSSKAATILEMDKVLGLKLEDYVGKPLEIPKEVQKLVTEREDARKVGNFKTADKLRHEIKKLGFEVEDTAAGPQLKKH